jgi:hypothetical protein
MKHLFYVFILLSTLSCATKNPINNSDSFLKVVHYNIKELDSKKLQRDSTQLRSVKDIVSKFDIDILSINEIQYDLKNIPNSNFKTNGENLNLLANYLGLKNYRAIFFEANTGKNAKKKADGRYFADYSDKRSRTHADMDNFGIFPGQYSTGVIIKNDIKVLDIKSINTLKWKDFNPKLNLSKYKRANGEKINPDIELFDKNFTDITAEKNGHKFHIILLHTVPAFHFGNKHSINYIRNRDQLRFLEWYLTGKTDLNVKLKNISSLGNKASYIAIGDWNTELDHKKNPGSKVLRRLADKSTFWLNSPIAHTNESSSYHPKRLKLQLDYISFSNDFVSKHAGIYSPTEKREELGCKSRPPGVDVRSYFDRKTKKTCYARFSKDFIEMKEASDHLPIWVNLERKAN